MYSLPNGRARTSKTTKKKTKKHRKPGGPKLRARRAKTLAFLDTFDTKEPKTLDSKTSGKIAKLLAHGYLTRTSEGYLRTNKEFQVNPS